MQFWDVHSNTVILEKISGLDKLSEACGNLCGQTNLATAVASLKYSNGTSVASHF